MNEKPIQFLIYKSGPSVEGYARWQVHIDTDYAHKQSQDKFYAIEYSAYQELERKLGVAVSLASHKFDCSIMENGKHECSCGYNELKMSVEVYREGR